MSSSSVNASMTGTRNILFVESMRHTQICNPIETSIDADPCIDGQAQDIQDDDENDFCMAGDYSSYDNFPSEQEGEDNPTIVLSKENVAPTLLIPTSSNNAPILSQKDHKKAHHHIENIVTDTMSNSFALLDPHSLSRPLRPIRKGRPYRIPHKFKKGNVSNILDTKCPHGNDYNSTKVFEDIINGKIAETGIAHKSFHCILKHQRRLRMSEIQKLSKESKTKTLKNAPGVSNDDDAFMHRYPSNMSSGNIDELQHDRSFAFY